jgi:hypothetical protein
MSDAESVAIGRQLLCGVVPTPRGGISRADGRQVVGAAADSVIAGGMTRRHGRGYTLFQKCDVVAFIRQAPLHSPGHAR